MKNLYCEIDKCDLDTSDLNSENVLKIIVESRLMHPLLKYSKWWCFKECKRMVKNIVIGIRKLFEDMNSEEKTDIMGENWFKRVSGYCLTYCSGFISKSEIKSVQMMRYFIECLMTNKLTINFDAGRVPESYIIRLFELLIFSFESVCSKKEYENMIYHRLYPPTPPFSEEHKILGPALGELYQTAFKFLITSLKEDEIKHVQTGCLEQDWRPYIHCPVVKQHAVMFRGVVKVALLPIVNIDQNNAVIDYYNEEKV